MTEPFDRPKRLVTALSDYWPGAAADDSSFEVGVICLCPAGAGLSERKPIERAAISIGGSNALAMEVAKFGLHGDPHDIKCIQQRRSEGGKLAVRYELLVVFIQSLHAIGNWRMPLPRRRNIISGR